MEQKHKHDPKLWAYILNELVKTARESNHDMRFGQLLFNAIAMHDGRGPEYDEEFHRRLFYVEDVELASILTEWFEWVEQQKNKTD